MENSDWQYAVFRNGQFSSGIYPISPPFYSDNPSGLHDGETPVKWQSKASFGTHPSTETEWPPKLLTRFSSWRIELHRDMQESL